MTVGGFFCPRCDVWQFILPRALIYFDGFVERADVYIYSCTFDLFRHVQKALCLFHISKKLLHKTMEN
jgi:hypothetical protein